VKLTKSIQEEIVKQLIKNRFGFGYGSFWLKRVTTTEPIVEEEE